MWKELESMYYGLKTNPVVYWHIEVYGRPLCEHSMDFMKKYSDACESMSKSYLIDQLKARGIKNPEKYVVAGGCPAYKKWAKKHKK